MAERERRRRVQPAVVEDVEEVVEEVEEEPVAPRRNLRNMPTRRRPRVVTAVAPLDEEDVDEAEEEEEVLELPPTPTPERRTRERRERVVSSPAPVAEQETVDLEEMAQEAQAVAQEQEDSVVQGGDVLSSVVAAVLDGMNRGLTLLISKRENGVLELAFKETQALEQKAVLAKRNAGLRGKAFGDEVLTEEYLKHHTDWRGMSRDEKIKYAKKLKVQWDPHPDNRVNDMRMTSAVREKLGIEKYKPQYQTKESREAIRG